MGKKREQESYQERAGSGEKEEREDKLHKGWYGMSDEPDQHLDDFLKSFANGNEEWDGRVNDGLNRFREEQLEKMPKLLPIDPSKKLIRVYVEGYEDVSFWRGIFDRYESEKLTFEISVPPRIDLAKGKRVVLDLLEYSSSEVVLCVDSDFDYLFQNLTEQSRMVNNSIYLFHTHVYSAESFLCYAPSLHNVCVKATKNDVRIFDFEYFLGEYSKIIYPVFLWYAYSARSSITAKEFTLLDFRSTVKLNYLDVQNNGARTLDWLNRQIDKRLDVFDRRHPDWRGEVADFERHLKKNVGLTEDQTYLYMHGHTLFDNVVMVMLGAVCEKLKSISNIRISTSTRKGTALKNEVSNYNNALRSVREVLLGNERYKQCELYKRLEQSIDSYVEGLS